MIYAFPFSTIFKFTKNMKKLLILLTLICSFAQLCMAEEAKRVLIIGNSYTFCNDLPNALMALSQDTKYPLEVESYTAGAMSLRGFLDSPEHAKARKLVESGKFDWIVLQDQSQTPYYKPEETLDSVERWSKIAKTGKAKVVLFMTWAHASAEGGKIRPLVDMQEKTSAVYCQAGVANKVKVAPVGEAWARWYRKDNVKPLHVDDMSHPNPMGTYLAACVIHGTISGKAVKGVSGTLKLGRRVVLRIPNGVAKELQKTANATLKGFTAQGFLDKQSEKEGKRATVAEVKAILKKGVKVDVIKELAGAPIHTNTTAGRKTYQFQLKDGAELSAYCNSADTIEQVSIVAPGRPVEIIDVTKL